MGVLSQVWGSYRARSKWSRFFIPFCFIAAIFDAAVGQWLYALFMLGMGIISWVDSDPKYDEDSVDWRWGKFAVHIFGLLLVNVLVLYMLSNMDIYSWLKVTLGVLWVGLTVAMVGVGGYFSYKMSRVLYRSRMLDVLDNQFPYPDIMSFPLAGSFSNASQQYEEQRKEVAMRKAEEYVAWDRVKGVKRERRIALAKVGIRAREALNPEVVALTDEDLAVFYALQNKSQNLSGMPDEF